LLELERPSVKWLLSSHAGALVCLPLELHNYSKLGGGGGGGANPTTKT